MVSDTPTVYEPQSVAHPGDIVVDHLEFNGWSQRELARRTGLTPKTISEICAGKAPISPPTALAFENALQRPAHFWLNLQRRFDEAEARKTAAAKQSSWTEWASRFPLAEMSRFKFLEPKGSKGSRVDELLKFFGVSSPESWNAVWTSSRVAYRQTRRFEASVEAMSAWVRATELLASEMSVAEFSEARLRSILPDLRHQTRNPAPECIAAVQEKCAAAGVAVVWVPELSNTRISGCARWLNEKRAIVGLTLRYRTDDQVWFTFFHEIAHILLHRTQQAFIVDNADKDLTDNVVDPEMQRNEEEANRFAADTLVPPDKLSAFIRQKRFTNEAIHQFSDEVDVGPGIVVGRLQFEGLLKRHEGNTLKRRFAGITEAEQG